MLKINELKSKRVKPKLNQIIEETQSIIEYAVIEYFKDKSLFNIPDDFSLFTFDELTLSTNTFEDFTTTFYLVINQPKNIKPNTESPKKNSKKKKDIIPDLYLTLKEIKEGLFNSLVQSFSDNSLIWQDKYSLNINSNFAITEHETKNYFFKVIPCFEYKNELGNTGVLYYSDDEKDIEIEYPVLAYDNFNKKNMKTDGAYLNSILIFKNIYSKQEKTLILPSEIFETILYNVPNEFFSTNFTKSALQIVNYLRNKSTREFMTLDEQDSAFTSVYRSMSALYCRKVINVICNYIKLNI